MNFEDFRDMIEEEFVDRKNKNILLGRLSEKLRKWGKYPLEYIGYYFETISETMPFHAAVSIICFREYGFFSEKLPEFKQNLYQKCEQNFIREISSDSPDLEYCANLHTALSLLNSEHIEEKITHAVETISEQWKKVLFKQISICIQAVNDFETEEQSLLAPILKSFYINYSAEINCDFLLKELKELKRVVKEEKDKLKTYRAAEITLSEILRSTIENKYFSYFKILYSLFPNWHIYQKEKEKEIKCEEFMELAFKYADSPEHLIDLLYVCLEISIGSDSLKTKTIEKWYNKIKSFNPKKAVEDIVSFIYYSKCIDAGDPKDYVVSMPYYEENKLFSEVLPAQSLPIGGVFVAKNTETILKNNPRLLKEYLEKTGKNNIYHFDTEFDCPEAPFDSDSVCQIIVKEDEEQCYYKLQSREKQLHGSCVEIFDRLWMQHSPQTILYFYFNTYLRKKYDIGCFFNYMSQYCDINMNDYIFKGILKKDGNLWESSYIFETSQFLHYKKYVRFQEKDLAELKEIFKSKSELEVYLKLNLRYNDMLLPFDAVLCKRSYLVDDIQDKKCESWFAHEDTEKFINHRRNLERKFHNLAEKLCTDESQFEKLKKTAKELENYPINLIPNELNIEIFLIIGTIENRIDNEKTEQIIPYLEIIKNFHECTLTNKNNLEGQYKSSKTEELLEKIFKKCDSETITAIYKNTELGSIDVNKWKNLAEKYDKSVCFSERGKEFLERCKEIIEGKN